MAKLVKKQFGGVLGFGTVGKQKDVLSKKDVSQLQKKSAAFQKESATKKKQIESGVKSGKIIKAGITKNKK